MTIKLEHYIRSFPDFPKPGIMFRDISPLLSAPEAMQHIVAEIHQHFNQHQVDLIAGVEARGLIFANAVAMTFGKGLVMVRKKGKLPGPTKDISYTLEYNSSTLEMQHDAIKPGQNVLIVDDLLATGGTSKAAGDLIQHLGGTIVGYAFVIELASLKGRAIIGNNHEIKTLVTYD